MPLYEYQCESCGGIVEKIYKMSEKPDKVEHYDCPHCNSKTTINSIMSAVAMSYNGFNHAAKVPTDLKNRFDQMKKHYPDMKSTF